MNQILMKITQIAKCARQRNLPEIKETDLEENGKIYYMNGDDGTIFDWQMNERLCEFMMFYNQSGMGAIKINVSSNGQIDIYTFKDKEKTAFKTEKETIEPKEALALAVLMNQIADEKECWDDTIDRMENNKIVSQEEIDAFLKELQEE